MNINQQNYEEYLLLYLDKELSAAERQEVEAFLAANPDLASELEALRQLTMRPDETVVFDHKAVLMKNEQNASSPPHAGNYEEYFLLYADNELSHEEKIFVEQFIHDHPEYHARLEVLQQAKLEADTNIVFPDKALLYRRADDGVIVVFRWWRVAAAAIIILFLGIGSWYSLTDHESHLTPSTGMRPDTGTSRSSDGADRHAPDRSASSVRADKNLAVTDSRATTHQESRQATDPNGFAKTKQGRMQEAHHEELPGRNIAMARKRNANENIAWRYAEESPGGNILSLKGKNTNESNGLRPASVLQKNAGVANEPLNAANDIAVSAVTDLKRTVIDQTKDMPPLTAENLSDAMNNPDDNAVFVAAVNGKNRLRGLVRKVTRVFEKTTNIEPADKGLRIANFEIGLR